MTEIEKLRALLAEAREFVASGMMRPSLINRIDAALAEPIAPASLNHPAFCSIYDDGRCTCGFASRQAVPERTPLAPGEGTWSVFAEKVVRERDEARAEVETLRAAIEGEPWGGAVLKRQRDEAIKRLGVTLEQLWAAEKERDEARAEVERLKGVLDAIRAARSLLGQLRDHVSDHACDELLSLLSDEPLDVDGNLYLTPSQAAYQRGAEAMREAAALVVDNDPVVLRSYRGVQAGRIRALRVPEDRP